MQLHRIMHEMASPDNLFATRPLSEETISYAQTYKFQQQMNYHYIHDNCM